MPVPKNKPSPGQRHKQATSRRRHNQQLDRTAAFVPIVDSTALPLTRAESPQAACQAVAPSNV